MTKTILLTGATDGIGFEAAKRLAKAGHDLLVHGRSQDKLDRVVKELGPLGEGQGGKVAAYRADLADFGAVRELAAAVAKDRRHLDVLINNAGVFKTPVSQTPAGLDIRFAVNTIAPYLLTKELLPLMNREGRVINLSSAAQAPVDFTALAGHKAMADGDAYAQSKLAITMWTAQLARTSGADAPAFIAVNPASFLGSKMVKEAYGSEGKDLGIGAAILERAALADDFAGRSGQYFDNDSGAWASPHPDAADEAKAHLLVEKMDALLSA